jgi:hypothetical protein
MWQPIETAPKDGTQILLAVYFSGAGWGIAAGGWEQKRSHWWSWMFNGGDDAQPTHWMPLPDPPPEP